MSPHDQISSEVLPVCVGNGVRVLDGHGRGDGRRPVQREMEPCRQSAATEERPPKKNRIGVICVWLSGVSLVSLAGVSMSNIRFALSVFLLSFSTTAAAVALDWLIALVVACGIGHLGVALLMGLV